MNAIESKRHYSKEQAHLDEIIATESNKRQKKIEAVDAYIEEQKAKGMSVREILRGYVKEYYHGFLDNNLIESKSSAERLEYLKELMFDHGIPQNEQEEEQKKIVH